MYHYFAATEIYNAIRMFIAAYVWMTGFGNFSYYYIRKDFSLARFAQVTYLCINLFKVLRNYMTIRVQYCLTDDVATQLPSVLLLCCSEQQLHALLHMPHAHPFHTHGLWGTWYFQQIQRQWNCYCRKIRSLPFDSYSDMGSSWSV